jgi:Cd2+/Zn2+-exporting ATPase
VEVPRRIRAVVLDKTGTLTEGRPAVREIIPLAGHSEREVLEIATAIERRSEHPLAQAIVRHATALGVGPAAVESYQAVPGKGAQALLAGRPVWIGSHRYLEELGLEDPEVHRRIEALAADGVTVVVVGEAAHACGLVALADRIRPGAAEAVADLRRAGVRHVALLSGDNWATARAIARAVGIEDVRAEVLPHEKVAFVVESIAKHGPTAMVGDGINDAPALARATLGIAMGGVGTDIAVATADVTLLTDELSRVAWLIEHSRRTVTAIRQNVVASIAGKLLFLVAVAFGHASLWAAIAADMGITILVIANALRLMTGGRVARA